MKAEKYLLKYMKDHGISTSTVMDETGIFLGEHRDSINGLMADDFLRLCLYLGITPEEVSDQISFDQD